MKTMTTTQREVLRILRERGAEFTAAACEREWQAGRKYYLDTRNGARRGIVRMFTRANREAIRKGVETYCQENPTMID